jgi:hypothetical protein
MLAKTVRTPARRVTTDLPDIDLGPTPPTRGRGSGTARANHVPVIPPVLPPDADDKSRDQQDKRSRFERLCVARMNRALTSIRLLGNLASPNYRWNEVDVEAIQRALVVAVNDTLAKFEKRKKVKPHFALPAAPTDPALEQENEKATAAAPKT